MAGTETHLPLDFLFLVMPFFAKCVRAALLAFHTSWPEHNINNTSIILQLSSQAAITSTQAQNATSRTLWLRLFTRILGTVPSASLPYDLSANTSMSSLSSQDCTTTYLLAHPPPLTSPTLQSAKLLLQLQEVRPTSRPRPAFEVIPAASLVPKLFRKSSRIVREKTGYGTEDMLILHAEDYEKPVPTNSKDNTEEDYSSRTHFGAICHHLVPQSNGDRALKETELHLADGTTWKAQHISSTCYEFTLQTEDEEHIVVRWTSRISGTSTRSRRSSQRRTSSTRKRFIFTLMDNETRHPALGTLQDELSIFDTYKISHGESPEIVTISEQLRSLMLVSGVWVIFMENWSLFLRQDQSGTSLLSIKSGSANSLLSAGTQPHESNSSIKSPFGKNNKLRMGPQSKRTPQAQPDTSRRVSSPLPLPLTSPAPQWSHFRSTSAPFSGQSRIEDDDVFGDAQNDTTVIQPMSSGEKSEDGEEQQESDDETFISARTRNDKEAEATTRQKKADRSSVQQQTRKRRSIMRIFAKIKLIVSKPSRRTNKRQTYVK